MTARAAAVAVSALLAVAACSALPRTGTKGTMPPPGPNGELDPSAMPDFIAVAGETGPVGWVEKAAVTDPSDRTRPVYGDNLQTVVGQLIPGKGFVPAGVDPDTAPTIDVQVGPATPGPAGAGGSSDRVSILVRNRSATPTWIGLLSTAPDWTGSAGFDPNNPGEACFTVADGDRVVLLDRAPTGGNIARPINVIYVAAPNAGAVVRWVDVLPTGLIQTGIGSPIWWQGDAWC